MTKPKNSKLRVLFAGTPDFAVPTLTLLASQAVDVEIVGVLTNPDAPGKRGKALLPTAVAQQAADLDLSVPILKPLRLDGQLRTKVKELYPDILVCVAYGKIFGPKFLELFPLGGINLHPSLLPKYRGPSPVQAAILAGDTESGITVQRLSLAMDSGDILLQQRFSLDGSERADQVLEFTSVQGAKMVEKVLCQISNGSERPIPQDEAEATYCRVIHKEDGEIDWTKPALDIHRLIRGYLPWPGGYTKWNGLKLTIFQASVMGDEHTAKQPGTVIGVDKKSGILIQTGSGLLALQQLQLQSKKPMDFKSFMNGVRDFTGSVLGGR